MDYKHLDFEPLFNERDRCLRDNDVHVKTGNLQSNQNRKSSSKQLEIRFLGLWHHVYLFVHCTSVWVCKIAKKSGWKWDYCKTIVKKLINISILET